MEDWQKKYLTALLVDAINNITCNPELLARLRSSGVLGSSDVSKIKSIAEATEKTSTLLETSMTRVNGYPALTQAVFLCQQSGAAKLFLNGYSEHGVHNPLKLCGIPVDIPKILSSEVYFQGQTTSLEDLFPDLTEQDVQDVFEQTQVEQDYLDQFIFRNTPHLNLIHETVPPSPTLYIPRSISNRALLHPDVFKENCPDIFVFHGIERHDLSELVRPNSTAKSSQQILNLNSRFILLETEEDWFELKNATKTPMHLVRVEDLDDKLFLLDDTSGDSEVIWDFVEKTTDSDYLYETEDDFLENINGENTSGGICVCDTPGMGKTYLLANLARKMMTTNPEKLVAFLRLSEFVRKISCDLTAVNNVLDEISCTSFSKAILQVAVERKWIHVELFFDGLDEVTAEDLDKTKEFLKALVKDRSNIRIYVSSRPHLRRELETTLGVVSYDILPFTKENQIDFLVKSWIDKFPMSDLPTMTELATKVLGNLQDNLNQSESERDIMGIPLQCYLLAEVYAKEARLLSYQKRDISIDVISIFQLFKRFMDLRFNSGHLEDSCDDKHCHCVKNDLKRHHVRQALLLLFPEISEKYASMFRIENPNLEGSVFSMGILEMAQSEIGVVTRFVHRTFAEFLVAEFFAEVLTKKNELCDDFVPFTVGTIFSTKECDQKWKTSTNYCQTKTDLDNSYLIWDRFDFQHSVILSFLNMQLSLISNNQTLINLLQMTFEKSIEPTNIYKILFACARHNYLFLFRFLKNIILSLSNDTLDKLKPYLLQNSDTTKTKNQPSSVLLYLSSQHPVQLIQECFQLFEEGFQYNLEVAACLDNPPNSHIPLQNAVHHVNYEVVEYLAERFPLEGRQLLYYSVDESHGNSEEIIQRKIEILKLLVKKSKALLHEIAYGNPHYISKYESPLVLHRIHLEVIKCLIKEGADFKFTGDTIIRNSFIYMSSDDFYELTRFLLEECEGGDIFIKYNCLNHILDEKEIELRTLSLILNIPGIKLRLKASLLHAVKGKQSLEIIKQLMKSGAYLHCKGELGRNVLHYAVENGDTKLIEYFLSEGLSLQDCDIYGETPLLYTNLSYTNGLNIIKYLVRKGADVHVINKAGETIAHKAAREMELSKDFHQLVVLLSPKWKAFKSTNGRYDGSVAATPLHIRLSKEKIRMKTLTLFLDNFPGMDINGVDEDGYGLIHNALMGQQPLSILKELVKRGVDIHYKTWAGTSVLDIAFNYHLESVKYFRSLGLKESESGESSESDEKSD